MRSCTLARRVRSRAPGVLARAAGSARKADRRAKPGRGRPLGALLALLLLAGCSTSKDAVAIGDTFQFVAPNGQVQLTYDPPSTRKPVGDVSGPSLADETKAVGLGDYPGKVVVLNVWGQWCGPCRTEAPGLELTARQAGPRGVAVLGIDVRDGRDLAQDFVTSAGVTYPSIFDYPGRSLAALGGVPRNVVPLTVVLDKQHRVAFVSLIPVQVAQLIPLAQRLAAE